jgi:F-type H+-transporting ATPase subunit delta
MAESTTVARPYAEAAFAFAREQNSLPVWAEMLRVAAAVSRTAEMRVALDNPKLSVGDKEALFLSICGAGLNADGRNFVKVLIRAERIGLLAEIRDLFGELKDAAEGLARAQITSAFPLAESELGALTSALARRFGKKIEATVSVDRSLIGGAKIVVGDTVIDGSVQGELQAMANHLRT